MQRVKTRDHIWEIQTPQALQTSLLRLGFLRAQEQHTTVTDDVAFAELMDQPVTMVYGSPNNIKITTAKDLPLAEILYKQMTSKRPAPVS